MTTTGTLADFILARFGEDEAVAERALKSTRTAVRSALSANPAAATVMAHPARVLAEVAAKRAILEYAAEATGLDAQVDGEFRIGPRDTATDPYIGDLILRALAQPYSDHEDFREEWRA